MAEIAQVVSETLQNKIRELLPSQRGFGEDLQASNVIIPIVDLTQTAEGTASSVPSYLQTAIAFGSQTAFNVINTTTTLVNTTGFYRVYGVGTVGFSNSINRHVRFNLTDGFSTKIIWEIDCPAFSANSMLAVQFDFVVFLASGQSLTGESNSTVNVLAGSTRQIADINGNLVNPSGF